MNDFAQLANDRYEIADALHRYAFALDHDHSDSLRSVLIDDCVFDFRPAGKKLGLNFPLVSGKDQIVERVLALIGPLQTSHTTSNIQIEISGDTATLSAYVMAQHFIPAGIPSKGNEFALLMNRYDCDLVRNQESPKWRFKRMTIDNAWFQGDPQILHASSTYHALRTKRMKPKG